MSATHLDVGENLDRNDIEGPGTQLRDARRRANFSLEEVSTELHLNADTVRALEESRFEGLPAPAFVRGYLRSYARLLNLPPDPILEAYDQKGFTPPIIVPDITQQPQAKSTDVPVRLATYLVAAGLVVMVVMWWQSRETAQDIGSEIAQVTESPPTSALEVAASESPGNSSAGTAVLTPPIPGAGDLATDFDDAPVADTPERFTAVPEAMVATVDTAPMVLTPSPNEPTVDAPAVTSDAPLAEASEPVAAVPPEADPPVSPAAGSMEPEVAPVVAAVPSENSASRLRLAFERESWVEVYDGDGKRLVYQLAIEGERMTLDAKPPIRVVLGYAAGAKVTFNGRDLDVAPFSQRGTARFLVAGDGTARAPAPAAENSGGSATAAAEPESPPRN